MRYLLTLVISLLLLVHVNDVTANEDTETLAKRGKGIVTFDDMAARLNQIPSESRFGVVRDKNRFQDLLLGMLLKSQIAAEAREAGFDKNQVTVDRMKLAAEAELVDAWMQHYIESQPEADFEQLAEEYYLLNKHSMLSPPMIDVSHILISTDKHTDEEATELVSEIKEQLRLDPAKFDELIMQYSEDPAVSANKGRYREVKKGQMIKSFEEAALRLEEGEISPPVKTVYGYHIIRLNAHIEPAERTFDEVKQQLVDRERKQHESRIRTDYLNSLTTLNIEVTEEALEEMVRRQFGEEVLRSKSEDE